MQATPLPERPAPAVHVRREALTTARKEAGMTTDHELAERMGVASSTVHRVLTRKTRPSNEFIAATLKTLPGKKFEDLFEH